MEQETFNLQDYIAIVKRRIWSLIIPALICIFVATAFAVGLPPVFKSTSKILIEEQDIPSEFVAATVSSYAEQRLEAINQRIMSSTRLAEVIQEFELYEDLRTKWTIDEIMNKMRDDIELRMISANVFDKRTKRSKKATIAFTLSYNGRNPSTVQRVANTLTSLYMEENIKVRERQVEETTEFLEDELEKIQTQLGDIETRIAVFKQENINQLPDLMQANIQALDRLETTIAGLEEQLRSLNERRIYLQTELAGMVAFVEVEKKNIAGEVEIADPDRHRLELLKSEYSSLQSRYSERHPDVIKTKSEIERLEAQLAKQPEPEGVQKNSERDNKRLKNPAYATLEMELALNNREISSVKRMIENHRKKAIEYQKRIETTPLIEGTYQALFRQRDNLQAKANDLLKKLMESRVAQGLEKAQKGERFTIIDPARRPGKPFKPNRMAIILVGIVLGIGAGCGMVVFREVTDSTAWNARDLNRISGLSVLGSIPEVETEKEIKKRKIKRYAIAAAVVIISVAGAAGFHFFVMDLKDLIAAIIRRMVI
jgi:polysaccharide chain length determinant protein (PEP-CTERM system associated)